MVAYDFGGAVSLRALLLHGAHFAWLCLVAVVALWPWGSAFFRLVHDHADVFAALPPSVHAGALAACYRQIVQANERFTQELQDRLSDIDLRPHHLG